MKHFREAAIAIAIAGAALLLAACNPVTIPNLFGGPPLVLTGNYNADLPSITAFNATVKAGIATDAATLQSYFVALCPYVADAQNQLPAAQTAATHLMTPSAAAKQTNNAAIALNVAQRACVAGTAPNLKVVFTAAVQAVEYVYGMVKGRG